MPLKHALETKLVVCLALAIALAGFLTSTLPSLPEGMVPWGILFAISIAYPILLSSLFRRDRADYAFRFLHWFPAAILLVWLAFELLNFSTGFGSGFASIWTWAWSLGGVLIGIVLTMVFCLHVIRRRGERIAALAIILVPYAALGVMSEEYFQADNAVASLLWRTNQSSSSSTVALDTSEDPAEEAWRASLRAMHRKDAGISSSSSASAESSAAASSTGSVEQNVDQEKDEIPTTLEPGGTGAHLRAVSSAPTTLPNSGFGFGVIALGFIGAYGGTLHQRARRRLK